MPSKSQKTTRADPGQSPSVAASQPCVSRSACASWQSFSMPDDELAVLLSEQVAYYRARAGEYDATYPLDQSRDAGARRDLLMLLEALAPYGCVLELACGTGQWTVELARRASAVTAVDSSPEALAICRARTNDLGVSLVQADLFSWRPEQRYDLVFFADWLSHVPPQRFEALWRLVDDCISPAGQVFLIDELPAVAAKEDLVTGEPAPAVRRRLRTGDTYRAVKVFYDPSDLRERLAALGWQAEIRTVGWRFFSANVRRISPNGAG